MSKQEVIICQNFNTELSQKLSAHSYDKIFILTDEHTFRLYLPMYGTSSATGEPPATRCS